MKTKIKMILLKNNVIMIDLICIKNRNKNMQLSYQMILIKTKTMKYLILQIKSIKK